MNAEVDHTNAHTPCRSAVPRWRPLVVHTERRVARQCAYIERSSVIPHAHAHAHNRMPAIHPPSAPRPCDTRRACVCVVNTHTRLRGRALTRGSRDEHRCASCECRTRDARSHVRRTRARVHGASDPRSQCAHKSKIEGNTDAKKKDAERCFAIVENKDSDRWVARAASMYGKRAAEADGRGPSRECSRNYIRFRRK